MDYESNNHRQIPKSKIIDVPDTPAMNRHAPTITILHGHVLDKLKGLLNGSVHCIVTSPPYWGLRDYSRCGCAIHTQDGIGGSIPGNSGSYANKEPDPNCPNCHGTGKDESLEVMWPDGWHGQLGLEPTPELYVQHIVQVFRELWRVLRDDGTLWLNMGDCYAGKGYEDPEKASGKGNESAPVHHTIRSPKPADIGLKPKDMVGLPWRVAFALQADGWYLRSDIIWSKPNPMPESVTDRPTKSHEYVFLLSKSAQYFWDADAVRERQTDTQFTRERYRYAPSKGNYSSKANADTNWSGGELSKHFGQGGRNLRTVWTIPTQPYPDAHFATFPMKLVEPCIKAGTSEKGCCAICGAPWERAVETNPNAWIN